MSVLDYTKITNIELAGIRSFDAPDYVDAFICSADYDGREMSELELDLLNEDADYIYNAVINHLY